MPTPVVAVEIGSSKTVALVGEQRENGHIMITGMGECRSVGVRKGEIVDLENAEGCLRNALTSAEESGNIAINSICLALSGGHIQSSINRGTIPVLDTGGEITADDVDEVMEIARAMSLPSDREVMHTICQEFTIDDGRRVTNPEGMEGSRLDLDMLILHGVRSRLHNTVKAARDLQLDIDDVVFSGLASAVSVLTPEQKDSGVIMIDLGGGTTDFTVYADKVVAAAGTLAVGGDHVTNDIVLAFNIPIARAERLKRESGRAFADARDRGHQVSLPAEVGFQGRTFSLESLNTVISARVDEILRTVRKHLEERELLNRMGAGVVLTGGGAHLQGIDVLAQQVFGVPCSVGRPQAISGLTTATDAPEYATCSGLVKYGLRSDRGGQPHGILKKMLRNFLGR
jgi:cell division protein FtsA